MGTEQRGTPKKQGSSKPRGLGVGHQGGRIPKEPLGNKGAPIREELGCEVAGWMGLPVQNFEANWSQRRPRSKVATPEQAQTSGVDQVPALVPRLGGRAVPPPRLLCSTQRPSLRVP